MRTFIKSIMIFLAFSNMTLCAQKPYWPFTVKDAIGWPLHGTHLACKILAVRLIRFNPHFPYTTMSSVLRHCAQKIESAAFAFDESWIGKNVLDKIDLKKQIPTLGLVIGAYYFIRWWHVHKGNLFL